MTPPATDRGLSDEDFALMKRVLGSGRQWPLNPRELSALLAAARREGEGGIASRDHASDTGIALDNSYQGRVADWMRQCFPPAVSEDRLERNDRFIEEALELAQSLGYSADRAHALVDYVFSRPIGEPHQEVGGVSVTLAALCNTAGLDLTDAAEDELERILQPEIILKIRAKQAAKPTGSALPIPSSATPTAGQVPGMQNQ